VVVFVLQLSVDFFHDFGGQTFVEQRLERFPENKNQQKNVYCQKFFVSHLFFPKNENQKLNDLKDFLEIKPSFYNSILFFIWGILI
jgi:hypothetical protein